MCGIVCELDRMMWKRTIDWESALNVVKLMSLDYQGCTIDVQRYVTMDTTENGDGKWFWGCTTIDQSTQRVLF